MSGHSQEQENENRLCLNTVILPEISTDVAEASSHPVLKNAEPIQLETSRSLELCSVFPDSPATSHSWVQGFTVGESNNNEVSYTSRISAEKEQTSSSIPEVVEDPLACDEETLLATQKPSMGRDVTKESVSDTTEKEGSGIASASGLPSIPDFASFEAQSTPVLGLGLPSPSTHRFRTRKVGLDMSTAPVSSLISHLDYPETQSTPHLGRVLPSHSLHCFRKVKNSNKINTDQSEAEEKFRRTLKYPEPTWRKYANSRIRPRNARPSVLDWRLSEDSVASFTASETTDSVVYLAKPKIFPEKSSSVIDLSGFESVPQLKTSKWVRFMNRLRGKAMPVAMPTLEVTSEQGPGPLTEDKCVLPTIFEGVKAEVGTTSKPYDPEGEMFSVGTQSNDQGSPRKKIQGKFGRGWLRKPFSGKKKAEDKACEEFQIDPDSALNTKPDGMM